MSEDSVGGTPTEAVETTALPEKSLMIVVSFQRVAAIRAAMWVLANSTDSSSDFPRASQAVMAAEYAHPVPCRDTFLIRGADSIHSPSAQQRKSTALSPPARWPPLTSAAQPLV